MSLSKVEDTFVAHVEKEVEDAEVGQETMFLLIDLIVGTWNERRVGCRMLGTNGIAVVSKLLAGLRWQRSILVGCREGIGLP